MRIRFEGYFNIPEGREPDDAGSIDNWLVDHVGYIINNARETSDVYDKLDLTWEVTEE